MSNVIIHSQGYIFGDRFKDGVKTYGFYDDASAEKFVEDFNTLPQSKYAHNSLIASYMDEPYELERHEYFPEGQPKPLILNIVVVDTETSNIEMHILEPLTVEEVEGYQRGEEQSSVVAAYYHRGPIEPTQEDVVVSLVEDVQFETYMSFDPDVDVHVQASLQGKA